MAGEQGNNCSSTFINNNDCSFDGPSYPPGSTPISPNSNIDELMKSLNLLANTLQTLGRTEDVENSDGYEDDEYIPLSLYLIDKEFLEHPSEGVRLLVGSCIMDMLRIYAHNCPYSHPDQIEAILKFIIEQLEGLKGPMTHQTFSRHLYILEGAVSTNCFAMCTDLPCGQRVLCNLFEQIFNINDVLRSCKVHTFMLDLLCALVTNLDHFSKELLNCIFSQLMEPLKSPEKGDFNLAKQLIMKCSATFESHMKSFCQLTIATSVEAESPLLIYREPYNCLYELYKIGPSFFPSILSELEYGLQSREGAERRNCVGILREVYSDPRFPTILDHHEAVWNAFIRRFDDIDDQIRLGCVEYSQQIVKQHPELLPDLSRALKPRGRDIVEKIRHQVVKSVVDIFKSQPCSLMLIELVELLKERVYDRKAMIRRDALKGLADIYREHLSGSDISAEESRIAIGIKNRILSAYYVVVSATERLQIERLLNNYLVPRSSDDPGHRMSKLLYLFVTMDEGAEGAFAEILKSIKVERKLVTELLNCVKRSEVVQIDANQFNLILWSLSTQLDDPMKMNNFLLKFFAALKEDKAMMEAMKTLVNPLSDRVAIASGIKSVRKKIYTSALMNTRDRSALRTLLSRFSSVIVSKVEVKELMRLILRVGVDTEETLSQLHIDLQPLFVLERTVKLVSLIAVVFPSHFSSNGGDTMRCLKKLLTIKHPSLLLEVLKIIRFVGAGNRSSSNAQLSSFILPQLIKICMTSMKGDSPKVGKSAFKCLLANLNEDEGKVMAKNVVAQLAEYLSTSHRSCRTAIVVLGHVAEEVVEDEDLKRDLKRLIIKKVIQELVVNPQRSEEDLPSSQGEWCSEVDLPLVTQCMISGLKCATRWITGPNSDIQSTLKVFKMLSAFAKTSGTFVPSNDAFPLSNAEKSWIRLTAGSCLLKVYARKGVGDTIIVNTVPHFLDLACLMTDEVLEVRSRFAVKLHNGLSRRFPHGCLPLDFMGFYSLGGFETNSEQRRVLGKYFRDDILMRRNFIGVVTANGNPSDGRLVARTLRAVLPEYALVYAIPVLTNHPLYTSYEKLEDLRKIESCLWFILEPFFLENENHSCGFFKNILYRIKNFTTGHLSQDNKMYAICDLARRLVLTEGPDFERTRPAGQPPPPIPVIYFKPHSTAGWLNVKCYLPPSMNRAPSFARGGAKRKRMTIRSVGKQLGGYASERKRKKCDVMNENENVEGDRGS